MLQTDAHPVVCVTWNDAVAFCKWASAKEGIKYRLPTEAEWEYACRAGTVKPFAFGQMIASGQVNWHTSRTKRPKPVGSFKPNAWGLYDMHGNAWEWCQDWYWEHYYHKSPATDPTGPPENVANSFVPFGKVRIYRGGSWNTFASDCRSANREHFVPNGWGSEIGFRAASSTRSE